MITGHFSALKWVRPDQPPTAAEAANPAIMAMRAKGIPRAPAPDDQSPVKEARFLLRAASEIEHGLLVQYLYAGYSAKDDAQEVLLQIAKEEMGHLICVQNLLMAVGSGPYFDRQNFSATPDPNFPAPYPFGLEKLSQGLVADFVLAESPLLEVLRDTTLPTEEQQENQGILARLQPVLGASTVQPDSVMHVGALYAALYWLFKPNDDPPTAAEWLHYPTDMVRAIHHEAGQQQWHLADDDFVKEAGIKDIVATTTPPEGWGGSPGGPLFVRTVPFVAQKLDRAFVLETLSHIAAQGEGWQPRVDSHFMRFLTLFERFTNPGSDGPPTAWNVPSNPTTTPPAGGGNAPGLIDDPESRRWARLFNIRYQLALLKLSLALSQSRLEDRAGAAGRKKLIADAIHKEMPLKLKPLAEQLVTMRRRATSDPGDDGEKAAPPFELPAKALPDRVPSQWDAVRRLIQESHALIAEIRGLPEDPNNPSDRSVLDAVAQGDDTLLAAIPTSSPAPAPPGAAGPATPAPPTS